MPYSGVNDKKLPSNIKKLPAKKRSQWVKVWNSTYKACNDEGGSDCEGKAFRIANGVLKKIKEQSNEMKNLSNIIFVELSALTDGKPFDGLTFGKFIDLFLRPVEIKKNDLEDYLANTVTNIKATVERDGGEIVGLPIDTKGHDKEDAAGWIVGASLEDGVLRLIPKWTEVGVDIIKKKVRRYFSATIDTKNKVILGGTLTNWPATRDSKGKMLLSPVELTENVYFAKSEESLDSKSNRVRQAWYKTTESMPLAPAEISGFIVEVYPKEVIVQSDEVYYKIAYTDKKAGVEFAPQDEWQKVERKWVEAMRSAFSAFWSKIVADEHDQQLGIEKPHNDEDQINDGGTDMELNDELKAFIAEQVQAGIDKQVADLAAAPAGETIEPTAEGSGESVEEILDLLELGDVRKDINEAAIGKVQALFEEAQKDANQNAMNWIANIQHEGNVREFVNDVTGGTEAVPVGLPVERAELEKVLLSLDKPKSRQIMSILKSIWEGDKVQFAELGTAGNDSEILQELPAEYAEKLDSGELDIAGMRTNEVLLGIKVDDYDLSKWKD